MTTLLRTFGNEGEAAVCSWLHKHGYIILARNFSSLHGEVDIIARYKDIISFVEVKTRKKEYFPLSLVITPAKQKRIISTAKLFLSQHDFENMMYRFDVATVIESDVKKFTIEYIEDAFQGE